MDAVVELLINSAANFAVAHLIRKTTANFTDTDGLQAPFFPRHKSIFNPILQEDAGRRRLLNMMSSLVIADTFIQNATGLPSPLALEISNGIQKGLNKIDKQENGVNSFALGAASSLLAMPNSMFDEPRERKMKEGLVREGREEGRDEIVRMLRNAYVEAMGNLKDKKLQRLYKKAMKESPEVMVEVEKMLTVAGLDLRGLRKGDKAKGKVFVSARERKKIQEEERRRKVEEEEIERRRIEEEAEEALRKEKARVRIANEKKRRAKIEKDKKEREMVIAREKAEEMARKKAAEKIQKMKRSKSGGGGTSATTLRTLRVNFRRHGYKHSLVAYLVELQNI